MTPEKSLPQKIPPSTSAHSESGASPLRQEAEARLKARKAAAQPEEHVDTQRLLHELQVHQIELEMQNEELSRIKGEMELSQARYFNLFDLAPVGILTLDEGGIIQEANLAAVSQLGLPRENLVNRKLESFILKEDRDIFYLHRRQLFESEVPQDCELRMQHADKSIIWVRVNGSLIHSENGNLMCQAVLSDITERKTALGNLGASEQRQQNIIQNSPDTIFALDISTRKTIFFNRDEFFGYTKQELEAPGSIMAFVHPDDLSSVRQNWAQAMTGKDVKPLDYRLFNKGGQIVWISQRTTVMASNMDGSPVQILVTISDITERKLAEQKLAASEAELRALFAAMKDVVIKYDAEGRYLEIAPTNPENLFRPTDEMLGKTVYDILPKEQADYVLGRITESLQTGQIISGEYSLPIDTSEIWFSVNISPLPDNTVIWMAHNITSTKHATDELLESERRFRETLENVNLIAIEMDISGSITFVMNLVFN